jgi:DNA-binding response OmpR family regulator
MIVEDDQAIREMYQLKFKTEDYDVQVAENGKIGLELAEKVKPDLILLDLMMPTMTGDEVLKLMRQTDWGKSIKVIILTNVSKDEGYPKLEKYGVSGYVVKAHYTPQEVVDEVNKVLAS